MLSTRTVTGHSSAVALFVARRVALVEKADLCTKGAVSFLADASAFIAAGEADRAAGANWLAADLMADASAALAEVAKIDALRA